MDFLDTELVTEGVQEVDGGLDFVLGATQVAGSSCGVDGQAGASTYRPVSEDPQGTHLEQEGHEGLELFGACSSTFGDSVLGAGVRPTHEGGVGQTGFVGSVVFAGRSRRACRYPAHSRLSTGASATCVQSEAASS